MTDREIIRKVYLRLGDNNARFGIVGINLLYAERVLVRYARLIERAKCNERIEIERNRVLKEVGGIGED